MGYSRFNAIKSQLVNAITQTGIQLGDDKAHVGIILSTGLMQGGSTAPYRQLDLNVCQFSAWNCPSTINSTANLITSIQNMGFYGGKNNISMSMFETLTGEYDGLPDLGYVFGDPYWNSVGDRIDIPNVMIVISGADTSNVAPASAALAAKGITVYSIGFSDLQTTQLHAISGDPSRSFSASTGNLSSVIQNICLFQNLPSTPISTTTTTIATTTTTTTTTMVPTTTYQPPTTKIAETTTMQPTTNAPIATTTTNPTTIYHPLTTTNEEITTKPTTIQQTTTTTPVPVTTTTMIPSSTQTPTACTEEGTWSEWSTSTCNDTCGLCGFMIQTRECLNATSGCSCIGEAIQFGERCNDTLCKFPKQSCCPHAKPTNVGGIIKCAPRPTTLALTTPKQATTTSTQL